MEAAIGWLTDITYMSELTPTFKILRGCNSRIQFTSLAAQAAHRLFQ